MYYYLGGGDGGIPIWAVCVLFVVSTCIEIFVVVQWRRRRALRALNDPESAEAREEINAQRERDAQHVAGVRNESILPPSYSATTVTRPPPTRLPAGGLHPGIPVIVSEGLVNIGVYTLKIDEKGTILGCSCGIDHGGRIMVPRKRPLFGRDKKKGKESKESLATTNSAGGRTTVSETTGAEEAEIAPLPPAVVAPNKAMI